jgi:hypothetical protein
VQRQFRAAELANSQFVRAKTITNTKNVTTVDTQGDVEVIMPSLAEYGGEPSVCGASSIVTTQIIFTQHRGDRPPMFVTRNTSDTRAWPSGSTPLSLSSSTASAVLRFATRHELYCAACPTCFGRVYFQYGTSVTDPIDVTTAGAAATLTSAIAALEVRLQLNLCMLSR